MGSPLYSIPGTAPATTPVAEPTADAAAAQASPSTEARTVSEVLAQSQAGAVMDELDRDLVGLTPIKARIRDIAALLVIDKLRMNLGLQAQAPSLHMSFTGNPGTGKTTVALRMAEILFRLGYVRKGHLVAVTRDDLVGQYIGHTAPKTREVLKRAMGGVLFIDEAYHLYRPENERDYGQEAIEILLQVMENQRDDLVVILAGYKDRMDTFFRSNPGMSSRIAHHLDFPDYAPGELLRIADKLLEQHNYRFAPGARDLGALLVDVAAAVKAISAMTAKGALGGYLGEHGGKNVQGEAQHKLDVLAHELILRSCEWGGLLAGMVSEELEHPYAVPVEYTRGRHLLVFDPLDGSSNTDVNVSVGTIFSVLRHDRPEPPGLADYQP